MIEDVPAPSKHGSGCAATSITSIIGMWPESRDQQASISTGTLRFTVSWNQLVFGVVHPHQVKET